MNMKINPGNGAVQPLSTITASASPTFHHKRWLRAVSQAAFATWLAILVSLSVCANATEICGPSISGTWTPTGNPYMITCDSTVPAGQTLTIQPGVEVWIFSNVTFTVNGLIQAVGTPSQRIKIGQIGTYWRYKVISVASSAGTHQFDYCDFQNAEVAISTETPTVNCDIKHCSFKDVGTGAAIYGGFNPIYGAPNSTNATRVMNCSFSNCTSQAIFGSATGHLWAGHTMYDVWMKPVINSCTIEKAAYGCRMTTAYANYGPYTTYGHADPQIAGNVFVNVTNAAFFMDNNSGRGGNPVFINNTVVNAATGVSARDPWDTTVQNCIFVGCTIGTMRTGSLSLSVGYNDYFDNATNFVNYPSSWGPPIIQNGNGTPCDVHYNIFQNPLFCETTTYTLSATSPCIDAGNPAGAYLDNCFAAAACQPGALGTVINDMGIYGGPDGCGRVVSPWNPTNFTLAAQRYFGAILNPGVPGHYRIEWSPVVTNGTWTQATNVWLTTLPYIYIDYDSGNVSRRFYRGVLLP